MERVSIINFLLIFFFLSKEKIRSRQTPSIMEKREILDLATISTMEGEGREKENDKSINANFDKVHLVTGFVFAPRSALALVPRTLTTCKLVVWERQTKAVKDLEPAVNGPRQFAFATRLRVFQDFCFPSSFFTVSSRRNNEDS